MAKLINSFPLNARSLIEASAGTGKTYTLSKLYMRLVLGHSLDSPASIKDILVVTFTNAATEELRGRIRSELREGLDTLMRIQSLEPSQRDEHFSKNEVWGWLSQMNLSEPELEHLKMRLILNLNLMDEASIYTIHGFCQRLLVRFALDTRLDFSASLSFNLEQPMLRAIEDAWRNCVYPLTGWQHKAISQKLGSPEVLQTSLSNLFNRCDVQFYPHYQANGFTEYLQQSEQAFNTVKATFLELGKTDIESLLDDYIDNFALDKRSFNKTNKPKWVADCEPYFAQDNPFSSLGSKPLEHLISDKIIDKSQAEYKDVHVFFKQMQALSELTAEFESRLFPFMYEQVQLGFEKQLKDANLVSSNDLLKVLYETLKSENQAGKSELAQAIRQQYPYALIDEFQDTDAIQYGIFNLVYPQANNSPEELNSALIMIGDPKQAIYSFRGADIHTYIQAKNELDTSRCFSLDTNWRSHPAVISALNHLWQKPNVFLAEKAIEYVPIKAGLPDNKGVLSMNNTPLSGLHIYYQNKAEDSVLEAAQACAKQIKSLLSKPAYIDEKPVESGDIAVLVRSKAQAKVIHQALKNEQVNSVLTSSESLFVTTEAQGLLSWLKAINQPADESLVRQAIIDDLQLEDAHSLDAYLNDEQQFENRLKQYAHWQKVWARAGIMAAIMDWLNQDERAVAFSQQDNGERRLTNLLHLGELLEQQARKLSGQKRLINWLEERINDKNERNEEYSLRLETDANLVQISTIHASKGLQYPLVFLPFLWADMFSNRGGVKEYQHSKKGHVFDFSNTAKAKDAHEKEALAENMRLLYVAMTRAESACFIQLINEPSSTKKETPPKAAKSALGRLLCLEEIPSEQLDTHFQTQQGDAPQGLTYLPTPNWASQNAINKEQAIKLEEPRDLRSLDLSHKLTSYSYLIKNEADAFYAALSSEYDWQSHEPSSSNPDLEYAEQGTAISGMANLFTKGANAGTCLHSIFELWDFTNQEALIELCAQQLPRYGIELAAEQMPALHKWLTQVVSCPIQTQYSSFSLAQIKAHKRIDELEFYLPVEGLKASQINPLIHSGLSFDTFKGHLKGFVDLIFCHDGRYYVADYKSNHLGEYLENYAPDELEKTMHNHHYDLQGQLYLLALDRLLAQRLPHYKAETHLGGILYLFVRGMGEQPQTSNKQSPYGVHYQAADITKLNTLRALFSKPKEGAEL